jgi:hypothetical protein
MKCYWQAQQYARQSRRPDTRRDEHEHTDDQGDEGRHRQLREVPQGERALREPLQQRPRPMQDVCGQRENPFARGHPHRSSARSEQHGGHEHEREQWNGDDVRDGRHQRNAAERGEQQRHESDRDCGLDACERSNWPVTSHTTSDGQ